MLTGSYVTTNPIHNGCVLLLLFFYVYIDRIINEIQLENGNVIDKEKDGYS